MARHPVTSSHGRPLSLQSLKGLGWGGGHNSYWNPVTAGTEKDRLPYRGCVSGGTPLLCRDEVLDEGRQGK